MSDLSALQRFGRLTLIPGCDTERYPYCHSLLVEGEVTAIVDPASGPDLLAEVRSRRRVDGVLNTR